MEIFDLKCNAEHLIDRRNCIDILHPRMYYIINYILFEKIRVFDVIIDIVNDNDGLPTGRLIISSKRIIPVFKASAIRTFRFRRGVRDAQR
jgi:hypothetical protein